MDAGTYAWVVIIAFFLVFTAVRAIHFRILRMIEIIPRCLFFLSDACGRLGPDRQFEALCQYYNT